MFYAHFVLAKKGPLARIWLAAHWDKKLTKAHVFETSIETSVEGILHPKVKMALRTSGHLLLGVVRIYSRKAHYLLADCNEAFVKIKMAFRSGMVDLPEDCREAAVNAITLKEVFHDFDDPVGIPELDDVDIHAQLISNQTRLEEITMREDYDSLNLPQNDLEGFGDLEFNQDAAEQLRDGTRHSGRLSAVDLNTVDRTKDRFSLQEEDGFGGDIMAGRDLFEGGIFDEAAAAVALEPPPELASISEDNGMDFEGPPSMVVSVGGGTSPGATHEPLAAPTLTREETLSFTLAPIETPTVRGVRGGSRRKRKLIVDQVKNLSGEQVKAQLTDTEDILTTLDLAPPSKQLMRWKETGGVDKLFVLPGRKVASRRIIAIYQAHLKTKPVEGISVGYNDNQDATSLGNEAPPILSPSEPPTPAPSKGEGSRARGRKRKALEPIEQLRENSEAEMVNFSMTEREIMAFSDLGGYQQPSSVNRTTVDHMDFDASNQTTLDVPSLKMGDNSILRPQTPREGHQDYEASVKGQQNLPETSEQELVLNQRAVELYHQIKPKLEENSSISFSSMCNASSSRKEVAQKFYSMLVLKKAQAVELVQNKPFEDIVVTKGTQTLSMGL